MMADQQPTTSGSDQINFDKENDLERARQTFEDQTKTQELVTSITVRRRRRGLRHVAQDLLFIITFSESDGGAIPILNVLVTIYQSIIELIRKLKKYFNDKKY